MAEKGDTPNVAGGERRNRVFDGTRSGSAAPAEQIQTAASAAQPTQQQPGRGRRSDGGWFPRRRGMQGREVRPAQEAPSRPRETQEAVLNPEAASVRLAELVESHEELREVVESLRGHLEEKDELNIILKDRMKQLQEQMDEVRKQRSENQPVPESSLDQIAGAIIRITIITLLGGVIGGPLMAAVTDGIVKVKIAEGLVSSFVAATSTEIANRAADPTSHRHRD